MNCQSKDLRPERGSQINFPAPQKKHCAPPPILLRDRSKMEPRVINNGTITIGPVGITLQFHNLLNEKGSNVQTRRTFTVFLGDVKKGMRYTDTGGERPCAGERVS